MQAMPSPTSPVADALSSACATPRFQPYRFIHKGLRVLMAESLRQAGNLDVSDAGERARLVESLERSLSVWADHLAHENQFFHEPLRLRGVRGVVAFDDDHHQHLAAIDQLRLLLQQVRDGAEQAPALAYELYLRLSVFIAESMEHMAEEEGTLTQALWAQFSDAELLAIEARLQATLAPEEMGFYLRYMARGMNVTELVQLLQGAREQMPAAAFDGLLDIVSAELDTQRWARLARALGVAPVPGLLTR